MRFFLYMAILLMLLSCNSKQKEDKNSAQVDTESELTDENNAQSEDKDRTYKYTVIFEPREDAKEEDLPDKDVPTDVSRLYYIDNFQLNHLDPKDQIENDTINLELDRKNLLIDLTYFQLDRIPYLMEGNDTLWVKYQKALPTVKPSAKHKHRKYDFAYDSLRMEHFNDKKIEANDALYFVWYDIDDYPTFLNQKKKKNEKEDQFIDSLYANALLSKPYYKVLKERLKFKYLNLLVSSSVRKNFNKDTTYTVEDLYAEEILEEDLNKEELTDFSFYYMFLIEYMHSVLNKNKGIEYENGFIDDSRSAFDSVVKAPQITNKKVKDYLLNFALEKVYENFSEEDFDDYFSKFRKHVSDSTLVTDFEEKYMLKHKKDEDVKEVYLAKTDQEETSLEEILDENRGKLVYLDFWASWCAPCIAEMPASMELQEEYKNKDIVFKYISIDQDADKWKKAAEKIELKDDQDFIAINYPKASFYQDLGLKSIPRYVLFDKNGALLEGNAPSPSDERTKEIIDQHLNEH